MLASRSVGRVLATWAIIAPRRALGAGSCVANFSGWTSPGAQGLPAFDRVSNVSEVGATITDVSQAFLRDLQTLEVEIDGQEQPDFSIMDQMEVLGDRMEFSWGLVSHLNMVKVSTAVLCNQKMTSVSTSPAACVCFARGGDGQNTDELREAKAEAQPLIVECSNKAAQSYSIYSGAKKIAENPAMWASLSEAQQRIVRSTMLNAELGGVALTGEAKDRFNAIALEEVSGAELLVSGWKRCTALTALLA